MINNVKQQVTTIGQGHVSCKETWSIQIVVGKFWEVLAVTIIIIKHIQHHHHHHQYHRYIRTEELALAATSCRSDQDNWLQLGIIGFFQRSRITGYKNLWLLFPKPLLSPCCFDSTASAPHTKHGASNGLESVMAVSANNNTNFVGLYTECCKSTKEVQSSGRWPQLGRNHYK
jgi:hypothetical protein